MALLAPLQTETLGAAQLDRYLAPVESRLLGMVRNVGLVLAQIAIGCGVFAVQTQAQTDPDPGYATQPYTPRDFRLPEGAGCSGDVARWQAVQENDYRSGNIGLPVYRRIKAEIAQAAAACSAGRDAQASAMIRASKSRHGYPD